MSIAKLVPYYQRMPYPLRVIAATARGYYLRSWRYSRETETLIQQAIERESWTQAEWQSWRDERLSYLLSRAATRVPYYHEYWQNQRRHGDRRSWCYLENWPLLDKEPLRANPRAFIADDVDMNKMIHENTSGTTGTSIHQWRSRDTVRHWYALFEARTRRWYGITAKDRWAMLGAQMIVPYSTTSAPYWVWNEASRELYMSCYHISADSIANYMSALAEHRVTYIIAFPSAIYAMAYLVQQNHLQAPRVRWVFSNGEQLFDYQRKAIEAAFNCRVVDTYGMVEIASAGSECKNGRMHLWPEVGITEVLSEVDGSPAPPGEVGELVTTGMLNPDNLLIRYRIGDRGALESEEIECDCGRCLPGVEMLEGRIGDVVITPDGRRVGMLLPALIGELPVVEAQIIQEDLNTLRVLVVPTEEYSQAYSDLLTTRLHARLGSAMNVTIEKVNAIPRTAGGKFRPIVSRLTHHEHPELQV